MKRFAVLMGTFIVFQTLFGVNNYKVIAQAASAEVIVLDRSLAPSTHWTDGDQIQLKISLPEKAASVLEVVFTLDDQTIPIANCSIATGGDACETVPFDSLGWYWESVGSTQNAHVVHAFAGGQSLGSSTTLQIAARPVVMVHGFSSSWIAWKNYVGADGYLAKQGLRGFAVGDGQAPGVMNTGSFGDPLEKTNTIAQNAAILSDYINGVKKITGAQKVDLLAHSMGGMIARYYLDRVMQERDVAQLIMLGTPHVGTDCAYLPASLGFYLPASLEIQPSYVQGVFNQQITHRHGVQFYELAGVPITEAFKSPCTEVPSDIVVSVDSAEGVPLLLTQMPVLHIDLNTSEKVFTDFVLPLLQKSPDEYVADTDPVITPSGALAQQFAKNYNGHLEAGSSQEFTIPIDAGVTVASFALFDASRSISVTVTGASGNIINLDPVKNGLIIVEDPASMIYLGYGFQNPKPGVWKIALKTTSKTPSSGADYALAARFTGGAKLQAEATPILPRINEDVQLTASLALDGQPIQLVTAEAVIHEPGSGPEKMSLKLDGAQASISWRPPDPRDLWD